MRTKIGSVLIVGILVALAMFTNQSRKEAAAIDKPQSATASPSSTDSLSKTKTDASESDTTEKSKPKSDIYPDINYKAPNIKLKTLDGKTIELSQAIKNKPVVVNFWASWCEPCRTETPDLVRLYGQYKGKVEFIGVNLTSSDSIDSIGDFVDEFKMTYPILLDREGKAANDYLVQAIPTTFFVNQKGVIVDKILGLADPKSLEGKIKALIKEK